MAVSAVGQFFDRASRIALTVLCTWSAGFCILAASAAGGCHPNREGEISCVPAATYSPHFYIGLRSFVVLTALAFTVFAFWRRLREKVAIAAASVLSFVVFNPLWRGDFSGGIWVWIYLATFFLLTGAAFQLWSDEA
jgi:hypothetical protein